MKFKNKNEILKKSERKNGIFVRKGDIIFISERHPTEFEIPFAEDYIECFYELISNKINEHPIVNHFLIESYKISSMMFDQNCGNTGLMQAELKVNSCIDCLEKVKYLYEILSDYEIFDDWHWYIEWNIKFAIEERNRK